jgi:hypothetical protein
MNVRQAFVALQCAGTGLKIADALGIGRCQAHRLQTHPVEDDGAQVAIGLFCRAHGGVAVWGGKFGFVLVVADVKVVMT